MRNPMAYDIARKWYSKLFRDRHTLASAHPIILALKRDRYCMRRTDTLSQVAETYYGNYGHFLAIALVNNIANPNAVDPGTVLQLPTLCEAQSIRAWIHDKIDTYKH